MKISTIIKLISVLIGIIIFSFTILTINNSDEHEAISTHATFNQLGLDLSGASDLLTNQARAYVQYGERKYYDAYMEEVNITKTRDNVVDELKRLGAPQNELALVEQAFKLSQTLAELESKAFEAVEQGDLETARQIMFGAEYDNGKTPIINTMKEFQETVETRTGNAAESAKMKAQITLVIFIILFIVTATVIAISFLSIWKKLNLITMLSDYASKMAYGNTDIIIDASSRDEIGVLAESFKTMLDAIKEQARIVEHLASGDLTVEAHPRSNEDTIGIALEKMLDSLNRLFEQISGSTIQVSAGSKQIADSAQILAQGSTQQAAAVEQLSYSIGNVADKTKENADLANLAASLSGTIREKAEKGSHQMDQMMIAVKEINEASNSISNVIKVIDDIAFQTNILALNAAVEAARAGQHGKGFAVVAEEVRSLAAKSAEAAKNTGSLIENTIVKSNLGLDISTETAASLREIVDGINQSAEIITQIAQSSEEQKSAITQINIGIDQVSKVIQQNSATAEESAASSEELNSQADMLEELITQFKVKNSRSMSWN